MKIYISEESKKELQNKIVELESKLEDTDGDYYVEKMRIDTYKEILNDSIVLPVEKNIQYVKSQHFTDEFELEYPNGVIIDCSQIKK